MSINLYPYQQRAIDWMNHGKRCAFYMAVGTGKTITSLAYLKSEGISNGVLVVCPKVLIQQWKHELDSMGFADYDVINYESIWRKGYHVDRLTAVILDESQRINGNSKQSRYIMKEFSPSNYDGYLLLLSGTPCGGKYELLYNQLKMLGICTNKKKYMDTFTLQEPIPWISPHAKRVVGYKDIPLLKRIISDRCYFLDQYEALPDLPELRTVMYDVAPDPTYDKYIKRKLWSSASEGYHTARRLSCTPKKLEYIKSLLDDGYTGVIFYQYTETLDKLLELTTVDMSTAIINGQRHDCHDAQLLFIQYQAGSVGLNLQQYHNIILADLPVNGDTYEQAVARCHRNGQQNKVTVYMPMGTPLDWAVYDHITHGMEYTAELFSQDHNL